MEWLTARFELSRGGGAHNVRPMEGLRGFAVFLVFLVHYVALVQPWIASDHPLMAVAGAIHTVGNTGVDLFFVLSGFLIYGSLISKPQPFVKFMKRRIRRIYPAFSAVFCLYTCISYFAPSHSKIPVPAAESALYLLQNFLLLPGLFPITPMITVAWSLSYEMFYYLLIPIVIGLLGLREQSPRWRIAFFLAVAVAVALPCAIYGGPIRLVMFISGILLCEIHTIGGFPRLRSGHALAALAIGLSATLVPIGGALGAIFSNGALFGGFFCLCLACFQSPVLSIGRAFSWTPLRWLGNMSYSYYLLHGLVLKAAFMVVSVLLATAGSWVFWVLMPLMFLVTLIPTAGLFLLVERPLSLAPKN